MESANTFGIGEQEFRNFPDLATRLLEQEFRNFLVSISFLVLLSCFNFILSFINVQESNRSLVFM